jgi:hypothetical protein
VINLIICLPSFKIYDTEVSFKNAAEVFNNYFVNITENLKIHIDNDSSPISFLNNAYPKEFPRMNIIPVSEGEIHSIICSLKSKNSSGYDGISTKIPKLCSSPISKPFSYICNKSITESVFPDCLKYATIRTLYKKGKKSGISNYRPISLLTVFSKY